MSAHPAGGEPFGVEDMVGNVWQWTDEYVDDHTRAAILRGGSTTSRKAPIWYFPQAYKLGEHGNTCRCRQAKTVRLPGISLCNGWRVRYTPHMYSRREFSKLALAAIPAAAAFARIDSKVHGVQLWCSPTASATGRSMMRSRPWSRWGSANANCGRATSSRKYEPRCASEWRTSVPMTHFQDIRKKFDDAGILLYAYNYSFRDNFTDQEIARGFEMAKALGVGIITASGTVSVVERVDKEASRDKIKVGFHGHSDVKHPNEFSTPETFEKAMVGAAPVTSMLISTSGTSLLPASIPSISSTNTTTES